jgi:hypothetical protein
MIERRNVGGKGQKENGDRQDFFFKIRIAGHILNGLKLIFKYDIYNVQSLNWRVCFYY